MRPFHANAFVVAFLICVALFGPASRAGASAGGERLQVCLLSGSTDRNYTTDRTLAGLARQLEASHPFQCEVVRWTPDQKRFEKLDALSRADVVIIFVRRMSPDPETLAAIRGIFAAGKGVVALRTASHAWETWPQFDVEVLGAAYGRHFGGVERLHWPDPDHPVLAGVRGFTTGNDMYDYELRRSPSDLQVLLEGSNARGTRPVAWVTQHQRSRVFYLGLGRDDEFDKPAFRQLVANGVYWVARRHVPGAELRIERTLLADAHPSSFAVGFPNGISFCYNPIRGGLDYAWDGGYVDVAPVRPGPAGKLLQPVELLGPVVYREQGPSPLRRGDPARVPELVFKGYRTRPDAIEFVYTLDGAEVREEIRSRPAGDGLVRRFRFGAESADTRWWYLPGATEGAQVTAVGAQADAGGWRLDPAGTREFTLEIMFGKEEP
jgi:type 1 glutamine amidotransferase